jgi:hypothetical protein
VAADVAGVGQLQLVGQARHVPQRLPQAEHVDKLAAQLRALGRPAPVPVVCGPTAAATGALHNDALGAGAAGVAAGLLLAGEDVASLLIMHWLLLFFFGGGGLCWLDAAHRLDVGLPPG